MLPLAAAALSGLTIAACFIRFDLLPVAWVAFAPLLWALRQTTGRGDVTRIALLAGLCTNIPAFYWLVYTITVFGGFPWVVAIFFYFCLSLFSSVQFLLFAHALRRLGRGPLALAAPVVWVTLEFLYPNLFPWRMANTQFHAPVLLQVGDLTGPFALSFAMVWFAAGVVDLVERPRRIASLASASTMALAIAAYGAWRLPQIDAAIAAAKKVRVGLVQGNISLEHKGDRAFFDVNLERYASLSTPIQEQTDLLIWPETVAQNWIPADTPGLDGKSHPFPGLRTALYFGGLAYRLTGPREADSFNSAFVIQPDGTVLGRYDKRILMPFGEFLPFADILPWLSDLSPATADFEAGTEAKVIDVPGKVKVGALICYEDLVAGMPRATTNAGAEVLVTILNDAWYGNSPAPHQHQALALWRTLETRRYLLRGSNTGVTSIIDAAGRVVDEGGLFTEEVIVGDVALLDLESFYARAGDVFAWTVVTVCALWLLGSGINVQPWRRSRSGR